MKAERISVDQVSLIFHIKTTSERSWDESHNGERRSYDLQKHFFWIVDIVWCAAGRTFPKPVYGSV